MIVYHFCCQKDAKGIRNHGMTKGAIPIIDGGFKLLTGWQCVTLDGDRNRQSWATKHLIRIDRLSHRYTIEIPEKEEDSLYDRRKLWRVDPWTDQLFKGWDGSENWRAFRGNIPKRWLKKLEEWDREKEEWKTVWKPD